MIKQRYQANLIFPAKGKYNHPVGEPVTAVDIYNDKKTSEKIWFIAPKVDGLYYIRAEQLFKEAKQKRKEVFASKGNVNRKDPQQGKAFINEKAVFEFFSISTAGIILLFSAIETGINEAIEMCKNYDYVDIKDKTIFKLGKFIIRYRQNTKLSKEQILFLDIKTKLKKVLPSLYNFESPSNQKFWQTFIELKRIRDSLTHVLKSKSYGAKKLQNSIFAELLDLNFDKLLNDTESLIIFIDEKSNKI